MQKMSASQTEGFRWNTVLAMRPNVQSHAAVEWLKEYLKDGPKPAGNSNVKEPGGMFAEAYAAGFKYGTIRRAAEILGVRKEKVERRWFWSLPEETEVDSKQL